MIRLRDVRKQFPLGVRRLDVLAGIDLDIERGEFVCVVGPAGCGKTTLLRIIGGLESATSGDVQRIDDQAQLVLMDEPFSGMDEQMKLRQQADLLHLWQAARSTVVYATHSIDDAIVLADRIVVMSGRPGRVKDIIDVRTVFGRPRRVEDVRRQPAFDEIYQQVWSQLRTEVSLFPAPPSSHATSLAS